MAHRVNFDQLDLDIEANGREIGPDGQYVYVVPDKTQRQIVLQENVDDINMVRHDEKLQIKKWILFAFCFICNIGGVIMTLYAMGCTNLFNTRSINATLLGVSMVLYIPFFIWFRVVFCPCGKESAHRRKIREARKKRKDMEKIRNAHFHGEDEEAPVVEDAYAKKSVKEMSNAAMRQNFRDGNLFDRSAELFPFYDLKRAPTGVLSGEVVSESLKDKNAAECVYGDASVQKLSSGSEKARSGKSSSSKLPPLKGSASSKYPKSAKMDTINEQSAKLAGDLTNASITPKPHSTKNKSSKAHKPSQVAPVDESKQQEHGQLQNSSMVKLKSLKVHGSPPADSAKMGYVANDAHPSPPLKAAKSSKANSELAGTSGRSSKSRKERVASTE